MNKVHVSPRKRLGPRAQTSGAHELLVEKLQKALCAATR
jgi:hypothetical protein